MDFLNIGPAELIVILIIAILVAGPRRMVEFARAFGRFSRDLRELSGQFIAALQSEVQVTEQETTRNLQEVSQDLENVLEGIAQSEPELEEEDREEGKEEEEEEEKGKEEGKIDRESSAEENA